MKKLSKKVLCVISSAVLLCGATAIPASAEPIKNPEFQTTLSPKFSLPEFVLNKTSFNITSSETAYLEVGYLSAKILHGKKVFTILSETEKSKLNFQWYNSNGIIRGATDSVYPTNKAGKYYCRISIKGVIATTPVKEEVLQQMIPYFTQNFGNPSSLYTIGLEAKAAVDKARAQVAHLIGADPSELYFDGGGSESDNWTIFGVADAMKKKGKHIITTKIEHHAILHSTEFLEKHGYEVTYLDVNKEGFVDPAALEDAIREDTILVSVMFVNNEIGTVEPIKELCEIAHKHGVLFHTDAVQAIGNVPIDVHDLGVDFMSMSSHKIYGPKGEGGMYIRKGVRIPSFIHGGAQEKGKRAGTENLAGIVGFGAAAELAEQNLEHHRKHCSELRDYLMDRITAEIPDVIVNGPSDHSKRHPGNLNVTFAKIEGESILLLLDSFGIAVSTGSACSSKSLKPSHVLSAIGVSDELIHGSVRFTVGDFTTKEDLDYTVDCLKAVVSRLREISLL